MFCGFSSFHRVDDHPSAADSNKKKRCSSCNASTSTSRRGRSRSKSNPYSSRGLDKFTSLLAELEARREKIMAKSRVAQQSVSMVGFMYSNSNDWIPIIIRDTTGLKSKPTQKDSPPPPLPPPPQLPPAEAAHKQQEKKVIKCMSRGEEVRCYYMPVLLLLILVCLLVFGRAFAICCTSVWWYSVPLLKGDGNAMRSSFNKDYVRRHSNKRIDGKRSGLICH